MSKNILSNFRNYDDYKNSVILPLGKKRLSKLTIDKEFSRSNDSIEELSKSYEKEPKQIEEKEIQLKLQNSLKEESCKKNLYASNIKDIRNKILEFANSNVSKEEESITPTAALTVDRDEVTPEELFTKLGEPKRESLKEKSIKKDYVKQETTPNKSVIKEIVQKIHSPRENEKFIKQKETIEKEKIQDDKTVNKKSIEKTQKLNEHQTWQQCTKINTKEVYIEYINSYPKGVYVIAAKYRMNDLDQ